MLLLLGTLLLISLLLEGTVTTIPLVLICLLCLGIIWREAVVFPVAFFAGIIFDLLTLHSIGVTSLFFTIVLFLVFLYQRKYEINSLPFVLVASFGGSLLFLWVYRYNNILVQAVISSGLTALLFLIMRFFDYTKSRTMSS